MKKPRRPKPVFDLPSPDEVNSAAAELSEAPQPSAKKSAANPVAKKAASVTKTKRPPAPQKKAAKRPQKAPEAQAVERNPIGRPRANHGRKSTSVMVQPEIWKRLKLLALQRDVDLSEMLEDLFLSYLKKEEAK